MQKGWRSLWNEKRSPTTTYFPPQLLLFYGLRQVTSSQTSMQYHSHNFKQPIRSCASSKWGASSEYQVEMTVVLFDLSFSYNNKTHSEIWILTLVATTLCADQNTTEELSFTVDSWINLTVQPNSRGTIPWFPPADSTIHYCPGPNLPLHISSHLLYNCLLKVHVNKCPFPPHLKVLWYI